jgi:hypothetical protein
MVCFNTKITGTHAKKASLSNKNIRMHLANAKSLTHHCFVHSEGRFTWVLSSQRSGESMSDSPHQPLKKLAMD